MGLWTPLLLLLHLVCVSLPAPANVSITSYNMEHILRFWPDPRTPPDARFTVQIHSTRKQRWKTVAECAELTAGQTCNLTSKLKDMFGYYLARVQALRTNQTSNWTSSNLFHPLEDTFLGPPEFSVSGCGNCLVLQVRDGPGTPSYHNEELKDLHKEMELNVRRTRDGAEFRLKQSYQQETVISYLQPGVEYCVSVSFKSFINRNSVPSEYRCAFTSPPPPQHTLFLVLGLLGGFTLLVVIFVGRFIYSSKVKNQHLPSMKFRSQSYTCLMSSLTEEDGVTT
ncbi:interferon alpha/beta receptor 2-like isoform X2 [Gambusia affinis]|uniref:interferon alpha/beta receptor 2-like isoform X2 n=1 Tax=Gambusia affinis TaxID=33528 RepID=UPI001CDCC43C|nr:interferon alpha/beta receptor 2-like isoform X2 [Gambusia affinis]